MVIRELITKWGFETDSKELDSVEDKFENIYNFSTKLMQVSGLALAAIITPAVALQDKITDAMTLSEGSAKQLEALEDGLTKKAISLSNALGIAGSEVAESFYDVISTGAVALSDDFNFLSEVALKMGKTVGMSASNSVEKLSDTVKGFGYEMDQASRVADVFFQASKNVATSVPLLTEAMREAGPTSQTLGMEIEETTAILSAFAESGLKGSASGTAFRQVMLKIGAPNANAKKSLAEFNTEVFDADGKMRKFTAILRDLKDGMKNMTDEQANANLKMLVGEEAFSKMSLLLAGNIDKIDDWEQSLLNAGGALDAAFNIKMGSVFEQLKKFWIVLKNVGASLGEPLLKPLGTALKFFNELLIHFVDIAQNSGWITYATVGILGLTFAISALVVGFVSFTIAVTAAKSAWALLNVQMLITYAAAAASIAVVILGIIALILVLDELYGFFTGKYDTMLQDIVDGWDDAWGGNLSTFERVFKTIGDVLIRSLKGWKLLFQNFGDVMNKPWLLMSSLISIVLEKLNQFKNFVKSGALKIGLSGVNSIANIFGSGLSDDEMKEVKHGIDIDKIKNNFEFQQSMETRLRNQAGTITTPNNTTASTQTTGSRIDKVEINLNTEGLDEQQIAEKIVAVMDGEVKKADNDLNTNKDVNH